MSLVAPNSLHSIPLLALFCFCLLLCLTAFAKRLDYHQFTASQLQDVLALNNLVKNERDFEKFLTEDYTLAKYLAHNNFDVVAAHAMFQETVAWRAGYNMSTILFEDWKDMRQRFPYLRDTFDKAGKPIIYINLDDWEIATFLNDGDTASNSQRFVRYLTLIIEEAHVNIQELRGMGRDVTQYFMLVNLAGFRTLTHGCIQCLYAYRDAARTMIPRYPYAEDRNIFINTPLMFKVVYAFLPEESQKNVDLYGQDRSQWESMLLNIMTPDQLPKGLLSESNPSEKDNVAGFLLWRKEL